MANGKKYYWMKLRKEFMEEAPISYLMGLDNGAGIVVLFIMLCMMCINSGGELAYKINKKMIPFNIAQIQGGCRYFSREAIEKGLKLFLELGLLYKKKNGVLAITGYEDFIGSETDYAIQKQRQRANRNKTADTARSDAPDPGEDAVGLLDVDMPADMRRESEGDNVGLSLSIPEEEFLNENKGKTARNDKNCPVDNQVDNGVDIDADKGWTSGWTMSTRDRERERDRDKDKDRVIDNVNDKYKGIVKEDYKDISSLLYVTGKNSQNISYSSNSSCAELEKISSSTHAEISKDTSDKASSEPKAIIPLDDGSFYWVSPEEAACYQELFPDTDVDKALGDISRWFAAHPCGIRTDLRAFIISWMKSGAPGRPTGISLVRSATRLRASSRLREISASRISFLARHRPDMTGTWTPGMVRRASRGITIQGKGQRIRKQEQGICRGRMDRMTGCSQGMAAVPPLRRGQRISPPDHRPKTAPCMRFP